MTECRMNQQQDYTVSTVGSTTDYSQPQLRAITTCKKTYWNTRPKSKAFTPIIRKRIARPFWRRSPTAEWAKEPLSIKRGCWIWAWTLRMTKQESVSCWTPSLTWSGHSSTQVTMTIRKFGVEMNYIGWRIEWIPLVTFPKPLLLVITMSLRRLRTQSWGRRRSATLRCCWGTKSDWQSLQGLMALHRE